MEFPRVTSENIFDGAAFTTAVLSGMLGDQLHAEGMVAPAIVSYTNFTGCMALVCVRLARRESIAEDIDNRGEV